MDARTNPLTDAAVVFLNFNLGQWLRLQFDLDGTAVAAAI